MDVWFGDDETADLCSRVAMLRARWGAVGGVAVGRRLLQIEAAPTAEALLSLPGRPRQDPADGTWLIDVDGVASIRFELDDRLVAGSRVVRVLSVTDQQAEGRADGRRR
jgi:hypothetical protein